MKCYAQSLCTASWVLLLVTLTLFTAQMRVSADDPPIPTSPTQWATDTAGFLTEPTRAALNTRLESYQQASGHQILVWVGKTTGKIPLEDWTVRAFKQWRIGRKGLDDGIILFVFSQDRKVRIEVGYGLEGKVPDATASRIIREGIVPRMVAGDPNGAVTTGVDQLLATLGGENKTPVAVSTPPQPLTLLQILLLGLAAIIVILLAIRYPTVAWYLLATISRSGRGGSGSGMSGGGGRSGGGGASGKW